MTSKPNYHKRLKNSKYRFYLRGNYYVKDLTDLLVEPSVRPTDFIYTKFVTTLVLIVPTTSIADFKNQYELWTENVIPGTA
jgi:V-type H+-transporting ATPase subunit C